MCAGGRQLVIGIDGGGTKTHAVLTDLAGEVLAQQQSGPSNLMAYAPEAVRENLTGLISPLRASLREGDAIVGVCIGSAGISYAKAGQWLREMLEDLCPGAGITVLGDMEIALSANSPSVDGEGVLLIAGTGSICFGRDAAGRTARAGGWGHIVSDEGSGYWIGLQSIRQVFLAADGMAPQTPLCAAVLRELDCKDARELVAFLSGDLCSKARVATLCKVTEDCALAGDETAMALLTQAAVHLYCLVCAVAKQLQTGPRLTLVLGGSVAMKCAPLRRELIARIDADFEATVEDIRYPAAMGAAKQAIQAYAASNGLGL